MKFIIVFFSLLLSGCATLRPDPSLPSVVANYAQLEIQGNPQFCYMSVDHIQVCGLEKGRPYSDLDLKVQGYYKGTYRAFSDNCDLDIAGSYDNSELIPLNIQGPAFRNCFIAFTLSPEYPKEQSQDLKIESFRGFVAIRVHDGEQWSGHSMRVTGDWRRDLVLPLSGGDGNVNVVMGGCGIQFEREFPIVNGFLRIPVKDAVSVKENCVLNGRIIDPKYQDALFTVVINQYNSKVPNNNRVFSPLPIPNIKINGEKLEVNANDVVSIISLDSKFKIDHEATFKYNPNVPHVLRLMTVSGRLVLGIYTPGKGWVWRQ